MGEAPLTRQNSRFLAPFLQAHISTVLEPKNLKLVLIDDKLSLLSNDMTFSMGSHLKFLRKSFWKKKWEILPKSWLTLDHWYSSTIWVTKLKLTFLDTENINL